MSWKVKAIAGSEDRNDESFWEVSRVPKEISASVVMGVLGRQLVLVIEKTRDLINIWPEEETFKMLVPDAPIVRLLGRKAIEQKLREENKDIKNRKRFLK